MPIVSIAGGNVPESRPQAIASGQLSYLNGMSVPAASGPSSTGWSPRAASGSNQFKCAMALRGSGIGVNVPIVYDSDGRRMRSTKLHCLPSSCLMSPDYSPV